MALCLSIATLQDQIVGSYPGFLLVPWSSTPCPFTITGALFVDLCGRGGVYPLHFSLNPGFNVHPMGFEVANHATLDSIRKLSTTFGGQMYVTMPATRALEIYTSEPRRLLSLDS